jgi:acyl-homoserine-lactone acylase
MSFRAQHSARLLSEDPSITFDELVAYKHSSRLELADHLLEDLVIAARASGSTSARAAAEVLEQWDRTAAAGSRGGVLFQTWYEQLRRATPPATSIFNVPWTARAPLATPDGLADPRAAVSALEQAAAQVSERYGALDVAWGDVHRLRRDSLDLPASGGPHALGSFRIFGFEDAADGKRVVSFGDSWYAAIEFARPVRARAVLGYGNASRAGSPHRTDQLPLVSRNELRDVWFARADVEANTAAREWF